MSEFIFTYTPEPLAAERAAVRLAEADLAEADRVIERSGVAARPAAAAAVIGAERRLARAERRMRRRREQLRRRGVRVRG